MDKLGWFMSRREPQHSQHVKASPWGRPTRGGLITSDGSMMLTLKNGEANTAVLYYVEYDT